MPSVQTSEKKRLKLSPTQQEHERGAERARLFAPLVLLFAAEYIELVASNQSKALLLV